MATVAEHSDSLTLYYSKRTGIITSVSTGIQDISFFGENAQDMELIYDFIVVPYSKDIIQTKEKYQVIDGKVVKTIVTVDEQLVVDLQTENSRLRGDLEDVKTVIDALLMGVV